MSLRDLPEGGRVHIEDGGYQVDVVRRVEGLSPELDSCLLTDREAFVERSIQAAIARAIDAVAPLVAELPGVRNRIEPLKCRRRYPLRHLVRCSLIRVTGDIGPVLSLIHI